jgi:hypothetical protein
MDLWKIKTYVGDNGKKSKTMMPEIGRLTAYVYANSKK